MCGPPVFSGHAGSRVPVRFEQRATEPHFRFRATVPVLVTGAERALGPLILDGRDTGDRVHQLRQSFGPVDVELALFGAFEVQGFAVGEVHEPDPERFDAVRWPHEREFGGCFALPALAFFADEFPDVFPGDVEWFAGEELSGGREFGDAFVGEAACDAGVVDGCAHLVGDAPFEVWVCGHGVWEGLWPRGGRSLRGV